MVVKKDVNILDELKEIISECFDHINYRMIDLCWEYLENLDDPIEKGVPYKFLTIYQEDFLNNHTVIYGDEIENKILCYEFDELIYWRANRLLDSLEEFEDDPKMLKILAGEVARLIALIEGAGSLKKREIMNTLTGCEDGKSS